jgi:hypothetical protein
MGKLGDENPAADLPAVVVEDEGKKTEPESKGKGPRLPLKGEKLSVDTNNNNNVQPPPPPSKDKESFKHARGDSKNSSRRGETGAPERVRESDNESHD